MIPLFDLKRVLEKYKTELSAALEECLGEAKFINGPPVKVFEDQLSQYLGVSNTIGTSSGTDALLSIFMLLRSTGWESQDEVLVTPFTFAASVTSIVRAGLKPVFVDLSKDSFAPSVKEYEAALTSKTRGILTVHLFRQ